jgi:outer membrane protein assembly factor BamB
VRRGSWGRWALAGVLALAVALGTVSVFDRATDRPGGDVTLPGAGIGGASPPPAAGVQPRVADPFRAGHADGFDCDPVPGYPERCVGWVLAPSAGVFGPPFQPDGSDTGYVGDARGVHALDMVGGRPRWTAPTEDAVVQPVVVAGDVVVAVDRAGNVYGLHPDGRLRWRWWPSSDRDDRGIPSSSHPGLHPVNDLVVVPGRREVRALWATSGRQAWRYELSGRVVSLASAGGLLVVGSADGTVRGLLPATGSRRWQSPRGMDVSRVDVAPAEGLAVVAGPATVAALELRTGQVAWRADAAGPRVRVVPRLDEVVVATGRRVEVLGVADGRRRRSFALPGRLADIDDHGWLYVHDGNVAAVVHPADGRVHWRVELPSPAPTVTSLPARADGARLAAVLADGGRLARLVADVDSPPPMFATLDVDDGCPVSPEEQRTSLPPHERVLVGDHVEVAGLGLTPPHQAPTAVLDRAARDGTLLLRGRRLDGPGIMRFVWRLGEEPAPALRREVRPDGEATVVQFTASVESPGCWAYQVDHAQFTDLVVFELSRDAFERLPAQQRHDPRPDGPKGW